LNKSIHFF